MIFAYLALILEHVPQADDVRMLPVTEQDLNLVTTDDDDDMVMIMIVMLIRVIGDAKCRCWDAAIDQIRNLLFAFSFRFVHNLDCILRPVEFE